MTRLSQIRAIRNSSDTNARDGGIIGSNVLPEGWTFSKGSDNSLIVSYNDSDLVSIRDSGEITSISDIGAYGNI